MGRILGFIAAAAAAAHTHTHTIFTFAGRLRYVLASRPPYLHEFTPAKTKGTVLGVWLLLPFLHSLACVRFIAVI